MGPRDQLSTHSMVSNTMKEELIKLNALKLAYVKDLETYNDLMRPYSRLNLQIAEHTHILEETENLQEKIEEEKIISELKHKQSLFNQNQTIKSQGELLAAEREQILLLEKELVRDEIAAVGDSPSITVLRTENDLKQKI
jgi:hypothetical protein